MDGTPLVNHADAPRAPYGGVEALETSAEVRRVAPLPRSTAFPPTRRNKKTRRFQRVFAKPSIGFEPMTPSLPCDCRVRSCPDKWHHSVQFGRAVRTCPDPPASMSCPVAPLEVAPLVEPSSRRWRTPRADDRARAGAAASPRHRLLLAPYEDRDGRVNLIAARPGTTWTQARGA